MSEGTAVVFQEGDRVKHEYDGEVDYGVITKKNSSIYTSYGNIWAFWEDTNMLENAAPRFLTLIERKKVHEPNLKYKPHKYADVIKHWADGGEIQYQYDGRHWVDYESSTNIPNVKAGCFIWRIKPEVKTISYRVGITKNNQVKVYHRAPTLDDAYGSDAFKDWLDPEWRSVEVEV